eukprot:m.236650 g.236650  ORF g.236650 m.236650 type:complete len:418 (+) comp13005_c0_seq1:41-1294(+)
MEDDEDLRDEEPRKGDKSEKRRGEGSETGEDPFAVFTIMESLHDKLKLLDYDSDFCAKRGFKSIPRHYFAIAENASEQLYYFGNLLSWLLSITGQRFTPPDQYDDPNTVTTNIMLELRKQGLPTEFSQTKLKQGSGEEVCQVLNNVAQLALKARKWKWSKPEHGREEFVDEAPHHEDVEVVAERVVERDEVEENIMDDDDDVVVDMSGPAPAPQPTAEPDKAAAEQAQAVWLAEVERVLPLLKIHLRADIKDWRGHVEEMMNNRAGIADSLTTTQEQLEKLSTDIAKTLEKIGSREKYVNSQLESLISDYRSQQDALAAVTTRWNQSSGGVDELSRELTRLTEDLDKVKGQLDEKGTSMTDASPLVKIKQALTKIKMEISQMDVRVGVIQHILLSASLREKSAMVHGMHAVPVLDDE